MMVVTVAGLTSYFRLGRNEDPAFTFRTMVVQAAWPGATLDDTLSQVTERLERKLQEIKSVDFLRSYTSPGHTTIFVNLKGSTKPSDVPDIWYQVRKSIGDIRHTLPAGVVGPGFNDEFGETYGLIYGFTAQGFTHRELRDFVEDIRSRLLHVPDVSSIDILGAQDEQIFVEFSTRQLAGLGIDRAALLVALQAQNAVSPSGSLQTGDEKLLLQVSGAFRSEQDILAVNFLSNGRLIRLRDIAQVRRSYADPPQPMFRVNGEPAIGLAVAMSEGGDILALGRNVKAEINDAVADLPLGIEPTLVSDQPAVVRNAIGEFMTSLWQAIAIIMAVSFVTLGIRAGAIVALSIPLTMAIIFPIMEWLGIDLQRISLGALIIALGLLVDDAMTTIDVMTSRLAQGDSKERAATFAYQTLAFPMLTGSFVTTAGFVPIGFARSAAGEYTFSIFAVVTIALIVSWFVAVLFAPLLGVALLTKPKPGTADKPGAVVRIFRNILVSAMRRRRLTIVATVACLLLRSSPCHMFRGNSFRLPIVPSLSSTWHCRRTHRSSPPIRLPAGLMRCSKETLTSRAGAPTSGAARSASIFPSTCSYPGTRLLRPSWSPRTSPRANGYKPSSSTLSPSKCRASLPGYHPSNSVLRSAGQCSIGCKAPTLRRCGRSHCAWPKRSARTRR